MKCIHAHVYTDRVLVAAAILETKRKTSTMIFVLDFVILKLLKSNHNSNVSLDGFWQLFRARFVAAPSMFV